MVTQATLGERKTLIDSEMTPAARDVVRKIQTLDAQSSAQDLISTFKQACHLRALAEDKVKFGPDAVGQALTFLGRKTRWGELMLVLARSFDEETVKELAEKRNALGGPFTKTHLEILATVEGKALRRQLIGLWQKEALNTEAFATLVQNRSKSASGESSEVLTPADTARTPLKVIRSATSVVDKAIKAVKEAIAINWKKLGEKELKQLRQLNDRIDDMSEMLSTAASKLPSEEIEAQLQKYESSAEATLGEEQLGRARKGKSEVAPPDPDSLFADVGGEAAGSSEDVLVAVRPAKEPKRTKKPKDKKRPGVKAPIPALAGKAGVNGSHAAPKGPARDRRR